MCFPSFSEHLHVWSNHPYNQGMDADESISTTRKFQWPARWVVISTIVALVISFGWIGIISIPTSQFWAGEASGIYWLVIFQYFLVSLLPVLVMVGALTYLGIVTPLWLGIRKIGWRLSALVVAAIIVITVLTLLGP